MVARDIAEVYRASLVGFVSVCEPVIQYHEVGPYSVPEYFYFPDHGDGDNLRHRINDFALGAFYKTAATVPTTISVPFIAIGEIGKK